MFWLVLPSESMFTSFAGDVSLHGMRMDVPPVAMCVVLSALIWAVLVRRARRRGDLDILPLPYARLSQDHDRDEAHAVEELDHHCRHHGVCARGCVARSAFVTPAIPGYVRKGEFGREPSKHPFPRQIDPFAFRRFALG